MNPVPDCTLALDAGGTFFKFALVGTDHRPLTTPESIPVDSNGPAEGILTAYERVLTRARAQSDALGLRLTHVAISTPGPFDYAAATSLMTHKFAAIRGLDIVRTLRERDPGLAGLRFGFFHDAHAFIAGECIAGAAIGHDRVVGVTLGTGIGFGCMIDGAIRDNGSGGPLVSLYRQPLGEGVVEDVVSRRGILRLYAEHRHQSLPADIDVIDVADRALRLRQPAACEVFHEVGRVLGHAVRPILSSLDIECLVVGGQISNAFPAFADALRHALSTLPSLRSIAPARHVATASLLGASWLLTLNESQMPADPSL